MMRAKSSSRSILATVLTLVTGSCATNPATGERMLSLISESQEIEMGQEYARQIEASMALVDDPDLQAYVDRVGQSMAAASERPDLPWSFKVVDDPVVNAFALPGGPIYVTRGIMTHFASEAEMAAVLGHEIGHITARHSVEQMSRQQLFGVGLIAGSIASSAVRRNIEVLGAGLGVLFLSYGRDDEHQSDMLGIRYSSRRDYDIREAVTMHEKLNRLTAQAGGRGIPNWLSTHPSSEDRIERIQAQVDTFPASFFDGATLARSEYLQRVDGLVYGPDPRQGFFQDNLFLHPDLEFRIRFPEGWKTANLPRAVLAMSEAEDALVELTLAQESGHANAAREFFAQEAVSGSGVGRETIGGFPATTGRFSARTQDGTLEGLAAFVDYGGRTYRLLGYTSEARLSTYRRVFDRSIRSFARLTDRAALRVQPMRIDLVRISSATSIASLESRRASPVSVEQLAIINGVETGETIPAGTTIKWVVGERPPGS